MDLALDPGDLGQSLAKIYLRMARIVPQRHEHLAVPQPVRPNIVLYDGDPATVAVLVAKPFEDPPRRCRARCRDPRGHRPGYIRELTQNAQRAVETGARWIRG